ncbi:hypothetical protein O7635_35750 [Asanoa sp. WMMD1127]|uniref:hypothetical protein n=1 Tax=Asanoa sp. WMMD1127 TaxID=3016107 RepID=UPI002415FB9A|nr:hypothetical protein [Asanoa sp. WMMD1127]MDG4827231.1 hypothetical protein [Asanoa sp. WMMD1127]
MGVRARAFVAALVVTALAGGACGRPFSGRVVYQGDHPYYRSVAELRDKADLVVEVTVADPRVDKLYPTDLGPEPPEETGVVITVYAATVTKVHKGTPDPIIQVQQMGGESNGVVYEQEGGIPFTEGVAYLLFLAQYPDAPAALLNPYQAQYEISGSGYRSLGDNQLTVTPADLG